MHRILGHLPLHDLSRLVRRRLRIVTGDDELVDERLRIDRAFILIYILLWRRKRNSIKRRCLISLCRIFNLHSGTKIIDNDALQSSTVRLAVIFFPMLPKQKLAIPVHARRPIIARLVS